MIQVKLSRHETHAITVPAYEEMTCPRTPRVVVIIDERICFVFIRRFNPPLPHPAKEN